jgi:serine O-acetyltransferase
MIQSKEDYKFYLEADRIALRKDRKRPSLIGDDVWKFERLMRKLEYFKNCKKDIASKVYFNYLRYRFYKLSLKLGFFIPENTFGPGLAITFYSGPIIVNAKVGADCRISQCVTIGRTPGCNDAPKIGNHVFIGPGAVIVGPIEIADGIAIGANSYVSKSFREPGITIAGVPARKILNTGSEKITFEATKILEEGL